MTAFGPYKKKETVDFRELQAHRLFAISGQTGAGKTTIFDAISFALYGSGSGEDRKDTKTMRSDFADDKDYTAVELLFELRGKTYRVLRQLGHVKQGNKTATGERYEFFEVHADDSETPAVDRQKVSDINKRLEELLGLTQQQFKQIVMLPQGEFRKLLTSDSKEKEEILRKIFKTEPLDQLVKTLDTKRLALSKETASARAIFEANVQQLSILPKRESALFDVLAQQHMNIHQLIDGLQQEAAHYGKQLPLLQQQVTDAQQQHAALQQQLGAAERLNEQLTQYERATEQYEQLRARHGDMMAMRETWQLAERAAAIEPYFMQQQHSMEHYEHTVVEVQAAKAHEQTVRTQLAEVKKRYDELAQQEKDREKQRLQIDRLEQLKPLFVERAQAMQELEKQAHSLQQAEHDYEDHVKRLAIFVKKLTDEKNKLQGTLLEAEPLDEKRQQLQQVQAQWQAFEQWREQQASVQQQFEHMSASHRTYVEQHEAYQQAYGVWLEQEAAQLADLLQDGQPCAVCGSTEHPKRAVHQQGVKTKEQLDVLRRDAEFAQQHYNKAEAAHTQAQQLLARYHAQCESLHVEKEQGYALRQHVIELEQAVEAAAAAYDDSKKLRIKIDNAEQKLLVEQQNERTKKEYVQQLQSSIALTKQTLHQIEQRMPSSIATSEELERQLLTLQRAYHDAMHAWKNIQELYQATDKQYSTAIERVTLTQNAEAQAKLQAAEAQNLWQQKLQHASFATIEAFQAALRAKAEQEAIKQKLEQYRDALQAAKAIVEHGERELANKVRIDVASLQQQIDVQSEAEQKLADAMHACKQLHAHCESIQQTFEQTHAQIEALVTKEQELITLYDLLRGKNAKKVSFERYVQIGFLEQITEAANMRLRYLSNGQFTLQCSDRLEGGGKQSGLSLDVYDAYTGLMRDVKTLSGGEKFNASLALALGMADVIQSFEGNIQIETMFIDEGFGSLDDETLTKAIDTLVDLQQSGRMIGIISHVNELKAAMPAVLQVTKSKEGHSTTSFILK